MLYRVLQATGSHDGAPKGELSGLKKSFLRRDSHLEEFDGSSSFSSSLPPFKNISLDLFILCVFACMYVYIHVK